MQRGAVRKDLGLESQVLALREDGDAVIAERAADKDGVAGRGLVAGNSTPAGTTPTPVVVMNTPSPLPFSTTFVSPVTTGTPASREARAMLATMRSRSARGKPSSRMKAAER